MTPKGLTALHNPAKNAKRLTNEKARQLHDLVEERLPAAYEESLARAQDTYDVCKA